jgi:hypothetical protein
LGTTDNNALVIKTGSPSTERLRIDPSGNVGIGTATPSAALHVAPGKVLRIEGGTSAADDNDYFSFGGSGTFGIDAPGVVNGRFVVHNSGYVGIGTSAPVSALHVNGAVTLSPQSNVVLGNGAFGSVVGAILREEVPSIGRGFVSRGSELAFYTNPLVHPIAQPAGAPPPPPPPGPTERLRIDCNGNVGIGTSAPITNLDVRGGASFTGNVSAGGNVSVAGDVLLTGADCAEEFDALGTQPPDAGTVMVIDADGALRESVDAYDKRVAGVVSGGGDYKHALVLDKRSSHESRVPLALVGKVYCKVDAEYSAIEVGDLLTTSATPGHAMKATEPQKAFGCVIGKALRAAKEGQSLIPILVALQ